MTPSTQSKCCPHCSSYEGCRYPDCPCHRPTHHEGWEEELRPKITIDHPKYKDVKDMILPFLDAYWEELKPKIRSLLSSKRGLGELIERCGDEFMSLYKNDDGSGWTAFKRSDNVLDKNLAQGPTPEAAVLSLLEGLKKQK